MSANSVIYNLGGTDKTLILTPRARLTQFFEAPNWTDLRFTVAYSITDETDPNDPTGLGESIGTGEFDNQVYIGFKQSDSLFPTSTNFFGLSTMPATPDAGPTKLVDGGDFYSFYDDNDHGQLILASDGTTFQNNSSPLISPRIQDSLSGTYAGYATVLILRMTRLLPTDIACYCYAHLDSTYIDHGVPFIDDTTVTNLRNITAAASQTLVFPSVFSFNAQVPDALFFFWPFANSRLRIHDYVLEKYG